MKKVLSIFLVFALLSTSSAFGANLWQKGTGENVILGSEQASDIDKISFENIVDPLDRLLSTYRSGCDGYYASTSSFSVSAGSITCQNTAGTIKRMRENTSVTTVTWANLDTGSEATSTVYYYYAVADADATTFTIKISLSSSLPSGTTYYRQLGAFYNNSGGDIEIGGIIEMYSGHVTAIPPGYVLCDGTNGTPDLRDKFIFAAGTAADSGDTKTSTLQSGTGSTIVMTGTGNPQVSGTGTRCYEQSLDIMPSYFALAFVMQQGV